MDLSAPSSSGCSSNPINLQIREQQKPEMSTAGPTHDKNLSDNDDSLDFSSTSSSHIANCPTNISDEVSSFSTSESSVTHKIPYHLRRKSSLLSKMKSSSSINISENKSSSSCSSVLDNDDIFIQNDDDDNMVKISNCAESSCGINIVNDVSLGGGLNPCSPSIGCGGGINNPPCQPIPSTPSTPGPSLNMIPSNNTIARNILETPPRTTYSSANDIYQDFCRKKLLIGISSSEYSRPFLSSSSRPVSKIEEIRDNNGTLNLSNHRRDDNLDTSIRPKRKFSVAVRQQQQSLSILSVSSSNDGMLPSNLSTSSSSLGLSMGAGTSNLPTPSFSAAAPSSPSCLSSYVSVSTISPSMLPARKRPRRSYNTSENVSPPNIPVPAEASEVMVPTSLQSCSATLPEASAAVHSVFPNSAAHYLLYALSDEVLLYIFSFLKEKDLCRVAQVCKRFHVIATDTELWKGLYQNLFEYDMPLFHEEPGRFVFEKPENSEFDNPWKESLKQIYHGVHVRPKYINTPDLGRCVTVVDNITNALKEVEGSEQPLIFLHRGLHKSEQILIDSPVNIIGASAGNVAENVVIEHDRDSCCVFSPTSRDAYLGHLTVRFCPAAGSETTHGPKHYSIEVGFCRLL